VFFREFYKKEYLRKSFSLDITNLLLGMSGASIITRNDNDNNYWKSATKATGNICPHNLEAG
jgi:hypothetical protein